MGPIFLGWEKKWFLQTSCDCFDGSTVKTKTKTILDPAQKIFPALRTLREDKEFTHVTLACEDGQKV